MLLRAPLTTVAVLLIALTARAQDERPTQDEVVLEYYPSRAVIDACPPAEYFYDEMRVRLGFKLFQVTAPNHLMVKVDRVKDRYQSFFELRDVTGKITLSNSFLESNCTAALRDVLVTVAVHYTRLPEPLPCVRDPEAPAPSLPPAPVVSPPAPIMAPDRLGVQAGLSSVFTIGKAPVVLGGAGLFLGVRWRDISAAVEGRALFAPSVGIESTSLAYSFVGASAVVCGHIEWAIACLRGEGGMLFGSPHVGHTEPANAPSSGVGFRLAGDWTISSRLAVRPYFEVMSQTTSSRMIYHERPSALWSSPSLSASLGIGLVMSRIGLSQETKQ